MSKNLRNFLIIVACLALTTVLIIQVGIAHRITAVEKLAKQSEVDCARFVKGVDALENISTNQIDLLIRLQTRVEERGKMEQEWKTQSLSIFTENGERLDDIELRLEGIERRFAPGVLTNARVSAFVPFVKTPTANAPAVKPILKDGVPIEIYNQIAANAAKKYPTDYSVQEYDIRREIEAYKKLHP